MIKTVLTLFFAICFMSGPAFSQDASGIKPMTFDGREVYHHKLENNKFKPCIDVLCTPSGRNILRDSPEDHVHHHALMFAVGVNGVDFWGEFNEQCGKQTVTSNAGKSNTEFDRTGWKKADFRENTTLDWTLPDGTVALKETREIAVSRCNDSGATLLTWHSRLAVMPAAVTLDGEHYYGLGMRFHESMDKNGRFFANTGVSPGEIVRGDERLTRCKWMAYTAKLNDKPVTVAVFDFPKNPRPMLAFTMGDAGGPFAYLSATVNLFREKLELTREKPLDFIYGVAVWDGEQTPETVESTCQQWLSQSLDVVSFLN
ncbi:MAG: PmoA family protein [Planctomycetaceae bacterium]|nr:PmoA family protein [Planctomycetaceae bacterium]